MALLVVISPLFIMLILSVLFYNAYKCGHKRGKKTKEKMVKKR